MMPSIKNHRLNQLSTAALAAARHAKLLEVPAAISGGLTTYTTDPAPIAAQRHELAKAIERLTNTGRE
ncbi:MAG: hypothetical protein ACK49J_11410 [Verrucomicrobiota bacterium]